jgi:hypothetical protein
VTQGVRLDQFELSRLGRLYRNVRDEGTQERRSGRPAEGFRNKPLFHIEIALILAAGLRREVTS